MSTDTNTEHKIEQTLPFNYVNLRVYTKTKWSHSPRTLKKKKLAGTWMTIFFFQKII